MTSPNRIALRRSRALLALGAALLMTGSLGASGGRKPLDPAARMKPLAPAVIDDSLAIEGEELAARKLRTRLTVDVGVNGTGPYRFVVDSGADTSVVGTRLATALGLPLGRPVMLNGVTESRRVDRVLVDSLQVGSNTFTDLELPRLEERDIGATGMIGLDALVEQRLVLDFDKRKITVSDARAPAPMLDGEIVVTARLKRGQLILTQAKANGVPVSAVVDTGSEITIGNSALREKIMRRRNVQWTRIEVTGVTGKKVDLDIALVDEVRLGAVILTNVPIAFADVPPFEVFGLNKQPALLLGTDLMETFRRVSLDFRNRKVRFQLRRCERQGIVISTMRSGGGLVADRANAAVCGK